MLKSMLYKGYIDNKLENIKTRYGKYSALLACYGYDRIEIKLSRTKMSIRVMPHAIVVDRVYSDFDIKLSKRGILPHQFCKILKTNDGKELADYLLRIDTGKTLSRFEYLKLYFKNFRRRLYGEYTNRFKDRWISCYHN